MTTPEENKKFAVEKYLEQIKILTALATTLLLSPSVVLSLRRKDNPGQPSLFEEFPYLQYYYNTANVSFLLAILATYFIYSSIVGNAHDGNYDVYCGQTRFLSVLQLIATIVGCISLSLFFYMIA